MLYVVGMPFWSPHGYGYWYILMQFESVVRLVKLKPTAQYYTALSVQLSGIGRMPSFTIAFGP